MAARKSAPKASKKSKPARKSTAAPSRAAPPKRTAARKPAKKGIKGRKAVTREGAPKGKASAAPLATGKLPVQAYLHTLPAQQRDIVEAFDNLVERTLPGIQRAIKWGMPFYGLDDGYFVSCGGFKDHVKITFLHGAELKPMPPVGTAKHTRGVDVATVNDLDETQVAKWLKQASKKPGLGKTAV
jgi:hypothetical protein